MAATGWPGRYVRRDMPGRTPPTVLAAFFIVLLLLLCPPAACADAASLDAQPLPELTARLVARYGGQQPARWGPALPGTLTRLPVPGGTGLSGASGVSGVSGASGVSGVSGGTGASPKGPVIMALTLDACGGGYDGSIIALLRELRVPATLFLAGPWLAAHPAEAADLAADPLFEIANHGARHRPASVAGRAAYGIRGTRSVAEFVDEVESNARRLAVLTGARPRFYRAAALFCDEVAVRIAADLGQTVTGCSVAADA
ncbi:polysaccharide deacetylase family protein, partial [Desulfovibrio oxamicus]|nr:polysaccharide deacetylase family protein [Nitratidesulfovibrio oxamicus]